MKLTPFGLASRKLRLELGCSLRQMAIELEIGSPYLSSIELGEKQLTTKIAERAINFFRTRGVSMAELTHVRQACDESTRIVPVSMLRPSEKALVAAFARRLSEGKGIPNDVQKWLDRGETP
ncbi:MAG: hypothetical protein JWR22_1359 [Herminiimonas sp.]|nr:hypothetical protein [Herminiimonas sp.]